MNKRIGNDLTFTWKISRKNESSVVPENFNGKDVEVILLTPSKKKAKLDDITINTGVISFVFKGKNQIELGQYIAVLSENKGDDNMVTVDTINAVTLVPHSYMEKDGDDGDVIEASSVELKSSISAGGGGGGIEQQQADWAQTDNTAVDYIKNKPTLASVATSGSYNDLSDKPDLSGFITNSVDNLVNYYLKSETYTKNEVLQLIGAIQQFHYEVYPTLPQTGASNVLYLIGPTGSGSDKYEEYVYANNDWTKIGDTSIDLSGYVTTQALTTALAGYVTSSALSTILSNYYNKTEVDGLLAGKANSADLARVATSGSYNDLSDKPEIGGSTAADVSYDNTRTGLSATNVQDAIDEMVDTNLYETVVLTVGSADSSFNPVGQTITVTLEDGSATQYTVPMSRQITFIVQRGMRYNISGTSTDDYRVLPISVKAAIPTRYLTMRYIPIATGVFILQKDGNYYLREEYDAETMAEDAVGILVLTSALINAGHGIVISKDIHVTPYTSWNSSNSTSTTSYDGLARTERMAAGNAACAVWCYSLRLEVDGEELIGFIGSYAEGHTVYMNVTEINLCLAILNGYSVPSNGAWRTSTFGKQYGSSYQYMTAYSNNNYCDQSNYNTLPFFYYPLL